MTNITERIEQIEQLKQILPKYTIKLLDAEDTLIEIAHYKHSVTLTVFLKRLSNITIQKIKFIHDNYDYFEELLLSNGFLQHQTTDIYVRDYLKVHIEFNYIYIDKYEYDMYKSFNNIKTMYDDLREAIGVNISYKPILNDKK